jgi:hypothetical protein
MLNHTVRRTDNLYEEANEAILIRDYPLMNILMYTGTCLHCHNPLNINQSFYATLISDDKEKHMKIIVPIGWFNCPHCQASVLRMQVWEEG